MQCFLTTVHLTTTQSIFKDATCADYKKDFWTFENIGHDGCKPTVIICKDVFIYSFKFFLKTSLNLSSYLNPK